MSSKLLMMLVLVVTGAFTTYSLYALDAGWLSSPEDEMAVQIAVDFLMGAPTFAYDGIEGTLEVVDTVIMESYPVQYVVVISFDSSHAGYGDRSDQMVAQVITSHEARVKVVNGEVVSTVIDGVWDEIAQELLGEHDGSFVTPESALEMVVRYLALTHDELKEVSVSSSWETTDLTPEGLLGFSKVQFTGAGWMVNASWAVVLSPVYTFNVEYAGAVSFTWSGTVDQAGIVEELEFEMTD
jgi:hypothetical protein